MAVSWPSLLPSLRLLQWPSWSVQRFFGLPPFFFNLTSQAGFVGLC